MYSIYRNIFPNKYLSSLVKTKSNKGFSFVELIITAALVAVIFGGLFTAYEVIISMIAEARMKSNALALASERMEYIRSLSYTSVGTVGGVPSGLLPQIRTITLNGAEYTERVLVSYIDDPADGLGVADTNGITTDYKLIKIELTWLNKDGETRSIFHTTNIVPQGIETTAGGGTIRVNVFDSNLVPVSGAEVRFKQASSSIDTSRFTGPAGEAYLSGAPQGSDYEIYVSKAGYSSDSTYFATTSLPNPITAPISVVENQVATVNFQIDFLGQLNILTASPSVYGLFKDEFTDSSNIAVQLDTVLSGGEVILDGIPGSYLAMGSLRSNFTIPATISEWTSINSLVNLPPNTNIRFYVYYNSASPTLVPDSDLAGNASGFTGNPIDISSLDPTVYPELALGAVLESSDPNVTPALLEWELSYVIERTPIGNVPLSLSSVKSIGTNDSLQAVPKYNEVHTSNGSGEIQLNSVEWGSYRIFEESPAYITSEICPTIPFLVAPSSINSVIVSLVPFRNDTLRVVVVDNGGTPVSEASVTVEEGAFSVNGNTTLCGQLLLDTVGPSNGYEVTVSKTGYTTEVVSNVEVISEGSLIVVTLQP